MNQNKQEKKKFQMKMGCHFKQIEDDSCFAYRFVNKRECYTCWKRYRFISDYMPVKQEYEARAERAEELRQNHIRRFLSWGGGIVTRDERMKV